MLREALGEGGLRARMDRGRRRHALAARHAALGGRRVVRPSRGAGARRRAGRPARLHRQPLRARGLRHGRLRLLSHARHGRPSSPRGSCTRPTSASRWTTSSWERGSWCTSPVHWDGMNARGTEANAGPRWAAWRSPTACSCTGRATGPARCGTTTASSSSPRARSPAGGRARSRLVARAASARGGLRPPAHRPAGAARGAKLPFERPGVLGAMAGERGVVTRAAREPPEPARAGEPRPRSPRSPRPWSRCAARAWPNTTARSTSRSAATSTASAREREHERCGSHMLGPAAPHDAPRAASLAGRAPAQPAPARAARAPRVGSVAAAVEVFSWMVANDDHPVARALARPGHELQHRFVTAEPTPEQLEVANAALAECLRLESAANGPEDGAAQEAPPA